MILNVSGRTDVVAFYMEWFMKRYKEGYVDVRNPFYPKMVSRIVFKNVDAILFCTKNPMPLLPYLEEIKIPYLVHVTLTAYQKDIEPNVPRKRDIIEAIKKISDVIGRDNVYIRYDPIFLSDKYNLNYHIKSFETICSMLDGYVKHIIVSFIDDYKNVRKNQGVLKMKAFTPTDFETIGTSFSKIAKQHGMTVQTCSEENNLTNYDFIKDDCLSPTKAFKLTGKTNFKRWQGRHNKFCHCVEMVDIGVYNTCSHHCKYCYANYDERAVESNKLKHNPSSSLLLGEISLEDEIKERI